MIIIKKKEDCCGCSACMNICPKRCIEMVSDMEGFLYPVLDSEKCIHCGLCEKVCPILQIGATVSTEYIEKPIIKQSIFISNNKLQDMTKVERISNDDLFKKVPNTYAMINKDEIVREKSSSGGIFTLIAEEIFLQNGVVFGATMTENCRAAEHICVEDKNGLEKLRGSKYIQSNIGKSYQEIKEYLETGRKVLFTGTPCQIEGLKTYLGKEYANLFCMDFICHGVPSPKVWEKYVDFRETCAGKSAQQTVFRHKKYGWKQYAVFFEYSKNTAYWGKLGEDLYLKTFLSDICLRPSCYVCRFKKMNRVSDMTVADFWGIEKILSELDDNKGTSLVMIHSDKGRQMFDRITEKTIYKEVDFDVVPKTNPAMVKSAKMHPKRAIFFSELENKSFDVLVKKYIRKKLTVKILAVKILKKLGLFDMAKKCISKERK